MRRGALAAGLSALAHLALVVGAVVLLRDEQPARITEVGFETVGQAAPAPAPAPAPVPVPVPAPAPVAKRRAPVKAVVAAEIDTAADSDTDTDTDTDSDTDSDSDSDSDTDSDTDSDSAATLGTGAAPSAHATPSPDPDSIRLLIERSASYPRVARRQGLEGRVIVRFRLDASGQPHDLAILTSAGDLLDHAAREAVMRAAPFPATPGWVRVPVDFSLRAAR